MRMVEKGPVTDKRSQPVLAGLSSELVDANVR
jgi:hypothetical protein